MSDTLVDAAWAGLADDLPASPRSVLQPTVEAIARGEPPPAHRRGHRPRRATSNPPTCRDHRGHRDRALAADPGDRFDMVLTNPPFGKKSSVTMVGADGETSKQTLTIEREDFWATTSNKQLNFLQHVKTLLKIDGRCAIVVPDNVLFEGGAGETIRRRLLADYDVHTLLRLPTGIFYAQGVKAIVLFFERTSDARPTGRTGRHPTRSRGGASRASRR